MYPYFYFQDDLAHQDVIFPIQTMPRLKVLMTCHEQSFEILPVGGNFWKNSSLDEPISFEFS